ncbi:alpha/beta hydrolase [Paenibacillus sp. FSL M7-1455]|uniref:alpha/beta fold hydrolase n=1 Tax=Paenibacillus sp. FSL M7-1455 TaxID=2975316 RepID=UPI0030FB11F8
MNHNSLLGGACSMERSIHQHLTRKGYTLEYSLVGSGEPVLILHGGHSNCHEELGYAHLVAHGFRVITPSRPGYGNTSAELGQSIMTACEAYIELLNELQVPQAHILAMSAGGPSGICLASRSPSRIKALSCNPPSPVAGCLPAIRRTGWHGSCSGPPPKNMYGRRYGA